eukprot:jgi/Chrzof1/11782/Cz06g09220.t1
MNAHYCCVSGLDHEVLCGQWDKPTPNARQFQTSILADDVSAVPAAEALDAKVESVGFSFRGDSRWLGVSKATGQDSLAGFCASGSLVYANLQRICEEPAAGI